MRVIDLTLQIHTGMDVFPGDPQVKIDVVHTHEKNTWELRRLELGSHTGTHVDAFSHMHDGMESLDDLPIERFFGKAQVVDMDEVWPKHTGLFFIDKIDFPHFQRIKAKNPGFVGGNITEELERALLAANTITYTGLINLDLLPRGQTFTFYGLPLRIQAGDGSPVRAIAIVE